MSEARRNNLIGSEEAASLSDIPNIRQKGTRLGNWLTRKLSLSELFGVVRSLFTIRVREVL